MRFATDAAGVRFPARVARPIEPEEGQLGAGEERQDDGAGPGLEPDAGDGGLALTGGVGASLGGGHVLILDQMLTVRARGFCAT